MVDEIHHPNFQMMVDCRSTETNEGFVTQALRRAQKSGHLRHVHANDINGKGPGFGTVPFTPILRTLISSGYPNYISVEVFEFDPDPETIASRSIGYLKGILEVLEEKG
jgi:sugar phosphate isomerase/epimerase